MYVRQRRQRTTPEPEKLTSGMGCSGGARASGWITAPIGTKMTPIAANAMITAFGVRIGRHALSVCCLKGVFAGRFEPSPSEATIARVAQRGATPQPRKN